MDTRNILKELRIKNNFSLKEVAEKSGVSYSAYQKYESGEREIGAKSLEKLADFYGVTTDYLLGREPQTDPLKMLNLQPIEDTIVEKYMKLPAETRKTFIEILVHIAGSAEKAAANENSSSAGTVEQTYVYEGFVAENLCEYEEYTAGELHEIMKSSDEDNAV